MKWIEPTDPEAFIDMPEMELPVKSWPDMKDFTQKCPVCKGHGGWNLQLNAYKLPQGLENTPENRSKYVHFRASCSHCNGWGYVHKDETCPQHEWVERSHPNARMCYHYMVCEKCGKDRWVDSSG